MSYLYNFLIGASFPRSCLTFLIVFIGIIEIAL